MEELEKEVVEAGNEVIADAVEDEVITEEEVEESTEVVE